MADSEQATCFCSNAAALQDADHYGDHKRVMTLGGPLMKSPTAPPPRMAASPAHKNTRIADSPSRSMAVSHFCVKANVAVDARQALYQSIWAWLF
jgi:hypothetical protein